MSDDRWQGWASADHGNVPLPEVPTEPVPEGERAAALDRAVNELVSVGWRVESRTQTQAVLARGHRPNHVLHAILTIFTCLLWGIVWLIIGLTQKEERQSLTVDPYGRVLRTASRT
ncbi:hypothetical protein ACFQVC_39860 [Streptomyces monticola]|uniref:Uncharacterized protein n=1 Tax=Streptomyces monticola TaxID=2666263 RepID=A0ABW2JXU3_9ACTN